MQILQGKTVPYRTRTCQCHGPIPTQRFAHYGRKSRVAEFSFDGVKVLLAGRRSVGEGRRTPCWRGYQSGRCGWSDGGTPEWPRLSHFSLATPPAPIVGRCRSHHLKRPRLRRSSHQSKQALAVILLNDRWRGQSALSFFSSARTPLESIHCRANGHPDRLDFSSLILHHRPANHRRCC